MNIKENDSIPTVGTTLYKEVQRQVLRALAAGEWKPGEAIPAEKKLCELFSVSIGTLRKAIDELVAENILIRHQGRGTYVAQHNRAQQMFRFFNVTDHAGNKTYPQISLVTFTKRRADKVAAEKLRIPTTDKVLAFTNLLYLQEQAVIVDDIVLPETLFASLTEERIRNRPNTLYNLYQTEFDISVIRTEERVRAGIASEKHAALLGIKPGAPILEVRRIARSYNDMPVEWRISYINTEKHEYVAPTAQ